MFLNNQGLEDIWLFHFGSFLSGDSKMTALFTEDWGNVALAHREDLINVLMVTVPALQQPRPTHGSLSTHPPRE